MNYTPHVKRDALGRQLYIGDIIMFPTGTEMMAGIICDLSYRDQLRYVSGRVRISQPKDSEKWVKKAKWCHTIIKLFDEDVRRIIKYGDRVLGAQCERIMQIK